MTDLSLNGTVDEGRHHNPQPRFSTAEDVNPPLPGDPGYDDYAARRTEWRHSIDERSAELPTAVVAPTPYYDANLGQVVAADDGAPDVPTDDGAPRLDPSSRDTANRADSQDEVVSDTERLWRRTDASNGEYFARALADRVCYDHRRRRFLLWGGHWWRIDDTDEVRRLAKEAARQRYRDALVIDDLEERRRESGFAIRSENRSRLEAMIIAARSEPPIADAGDHWDRDPWLLGVANGVVDLQTGRLRPGTVVDRITCHTDIAFDRDATCPRWYRFVDEIFDGDTELVAFLQRAMGYSLTGDVSEQCLFLCHGTGANGKSVLLSVLLAIAGGYTANTPFSTFERNGRASIPNDLAALAGKRLVTASETGEDVRLNEARLKAVTGGDPVTARFLHGEFFTYQPVAKFWLSVNHKPRVTDDSHGFWRRVRLVPFDRRFEDDADPDLLETLLTELPGILLWAVEGALIWQSTGLAAPAVVKTATATYRVESDPIGDFLATRAIEQAELTVKASDAYAAYRAWAGDEGLNDRETLSSKAFGTRMTERYAKTRTGRGNVYHGVGLRTDRLDEGPSVGSSAGS